MEIIGNGWQIGNAEDINNKKVTLKYYDDIRG